MDNLVRIILQNAWRSPLQLLFLVISTISLSLFSFQFLVSLDDIFSKNLASIYFQVPVHMCVVNVYFLQNLLPHLFLCDPVFLLYFACLSSWPVRMWVHLLSFHHIRLCHYMLKLLVLNICTPAWCVVRSFCCSLLFVRVSRKHLLTMMRLQENLSQDRNDDSERRNGKRWLCGWP